MVVAVLVCTRVAAQSIWLDMGSRSNVTVQFLKPNFYDASSEFVSTDYALFITSRLFVSERLAFAFELPIAHSSQETNPFGGEESQTMDGNFYFGIDTGPRKHPTLRIEIGFRSATAEENKERAATIGTFADIERYGTTAKPMASFNLLVNAVPRVNDYVHIRIRVGPTMFFPEGAEDDASLNLGLILVAEHAHFRAHSGIAGWTFLTSKETAFSSEASAFMFGIGAGPKIGRFYAGIDVRVPLFGQPFGMRTSLTQVLETVIGVSVTGFFDMSGSEN